MTILFSPVAYQKLRYFLNNKDDVEIAGFGQTSPEYPEVIIDFHLVGQIAEPVDVTMTEDGIQDYVDKMSDLDVPMNECFRIWIHTHPTFSTSPSAQDIKTFQELYESNPWFAMIILNRKDEWHGEIGYKSGPVPTSYEVDLDIDWDYPCDRIVNFAELDEQYNKLVTVKKKVVVNNPNGHFGTYGKLPSLYQNVKPKEEKAYDDDLWGRFEDTGADDIDFLSDEELKDLIKEGLKND